jgi:hypothetical protein
MNRLAAAFASPPAASVAVTGGEVRAVDLAN